MVTLAQALRAGLTRDQVRQLCRSGRWQRLVRSCFVPTAELSGGIAPGAGSGSSDKPWPRCLRCLRHRTGAVRHRGASPGFAGSRLGCD
ncbi:hypothetical protein [Micromonospora sp. NPDC005113]